MGTTWAPPAFTRIPVEGKLLLGSLSLFFAGAAQNIHHRVVAFVAGVLKYRTWSRAEWILDGPALRKCGGVVDSGAIEQRIRADASEPLDDVQVLRRSAEVD